MPPRPDFSQEAYLEGLREQQEAKRRAQAEDKLRDRQANLAHMANDDMAGGRGGQSFDPFLREQASRINGAARQLGVDFSSEPVASSAQAAMQQAMPAQGGAIIGAGNRDVSSLFGPRGGAAVPIAPPAQPPRDLSQMSERDRAWEQKRLARLARQQGGQAPAPPVAVSNGGGSARDAAYEAKLRARQERMAGEQQQAPPPQRPLLPQQPQYQEQSPQYEEPPPRQQPPPPQQQRQEPPPQYRQYQEPEPEPFGGRGGRGGRGGAAPDERYSDAPPRPEVGRSDARRQQQEYAAALQQQQQEKAQRDRENRELQRAPGGGGNVDAQADLRRRQQAEYARDLEEQMAAKGQREQQARRGGGGGGGDIFGGGGDGGDARRRQQQAYAHDLEQQVAAKERRDQQERRGGDAGECTTWIDQR